MKGSRTTTYGYRWIDELYLGNVREPSPESFKTFYRGLLTKQAEGTFELAAAGRDIRERRARQRRTLAVNRMMEKAFKEMLRAREITKVNWMYRRLGR